MNDVAERLCLVTGASGFVGGWMVDRLLARGARVRCLLRPTSNRSNLPIDRISIAAGDVTDPDSVRRAVADCDYLFHIAGLIKARQAADYLRVNRDGTLNALEAARATRGTPPRVVVLSSLAAHGPSQPGRPADESLEPHPFSPYGVSKRLAEIATLSYATDLPVTIVRPPSVYGPRDREMLLVMQLAGMPIRPGFGGRGALSMIHVSDLVDALVLAATTDGAVGNTYFVASDETPSLDGLLSMIARARDAWGISVPVPLPLIVASGFVAEIVRNLTGVPLIFDRWKARELTLGYWACSNERARRDMGFEPRYPLVEGISDTVTWYQKAGWLH